MRNESRIRLVAVPVDDFFETYVEELGARGSGLQQDVLAGTPVTTGDARLHHVLHVDASHCTIVQHDGSPLRHSIFSWRFAPGL